MADRIELTEIERNVTFAYSDPKTGRIFALMGPNGAGKSRSLMQLKDFLDNLKTPCFLLPSTRHFGQNPFPIKLSNNDEEPLWTTILHDLARWRRPKDDTKMPYSAYVQRRPEPFNDALVSFLSALKNEDEKSREEYRTKLESWQAGGRHGLDPIRQPEKIAKVRSILKRILGHDFDIESPAGSNSVTIKYQNSTGTFGVEDLSDGEKQILLLSVLFFNGHKRMVFLVDEPELHLNDSRAIELWEALENEFPASVFVYASHSLIFSTRPTVSRTYFIGMDGKIDMLSPDDPTPAPVIRSIVGARIQLARTDKAPIFCEDGLIKLIIDDIFRGDPIETICCDGKDSVLAAVQRDGPWKNVRSSGANFCGIVDRDTRSDVQVSTMAKKGVFCLPVYESESFLIDPIISAWNLSTALGREVDRETCKQILVDAARTLINPTLRELERDLCRNHYCTITFKFGPNAVQNVQVQPPADLESEFISRAEAIHNAVETSDVQKILKLIDGKKLFKKFVVGANRKLKTNLSGEANQNYNVLRQNKDFEEKITEVQWLMDFKQSIKTYLNQS